MRFNKSNKAIIVLVQEKKARGLARRVPMGCRMYSLHSKSEAMLEDLIGAGGDRLVQEKVNRELSKRLPQAMKLFPFM